MAEENVTVGGAPMYPSKNIIQNAVNSKGHTTLVAAVKAAGLAETLSGAGPLSSPNCWRDGSAPKLPPPLGRRPGPCGTGHSKDSIR